MLRGMSERVHVVGIGGIGTSALAVILAQAGAVVSGSEDSGTILAGELLDRFPEISVWRGYSAGHLDGVDRLIHSVAVRPDNPELAGARRRGIPVLTYPQALGRFLAGTDVCGVAGTHGKTTTTAMIAMAAEEAGLPVSYLVGAPMQGARCNVRYTPGSPFVLEADEYRGAFLEYADRFAQLVITNIDFDHPDYYPSQDAVEKAFSELLAHIPHGARVFACGDSRGVQAVSRVHDRIITYGFGPGNAVRVELVGVSDAASVFTVTGAADDRVRLRVKVPGRHNVLNATAAFLAARALGCPVAAIATALEGYVGARRRFDVRIGMFFPPSGAVQVADQPGRVLAARADLPDHRSLAPGHRSRSAECHRLGSGTTRNAIRAGADRRGTWSAHSGPADGGAEHGPVAGPRGPGARMARRNLVRRSSPAASSRAARRMLSSAYRGRSPDHCPVAFSRATAWFRLTPIRRTSSAARSRA